MSYTALYRKYRSQNFDEIVGQKHIITSLTNQIKNNQVGMLICLRELGERAKLV